MKSEQFNHLLQESLAKGTLLQAILYRPALKSSEVSKVTIRPLKIKGALFYQLTNHYRQKVTHANAEPQRLLEIVWKLLETDFREAQFHTEEADYHVLVNKKGAWTILQKTAARKNEVQPHNRLKGYLLPEGTPIPFLVELGVMRSDGSLVPKMSAKFRQINRFVEMVADILPELRQEGTLHIIDFGCGKSYLTFAIYHYLHVVKKREVEILGLDLKADVVRHCQELALKLGYGGLRFEVGDINMHAPRSKVDMVVTLHACDTATDAALEKAVQWKADVILCVPCCQHELFRQVHCEGLTPLLKHGILRERFAALATDAARAELLEIVGYKVQVMEFIDLEHTPKNLLIRAVRGNVSSAAAVLEYTAFREMLRITPSLQKRLAL